MNLDPAATNVSGSCGVNSSELTLVSSNMKVVFTFANVSPNQTNHHYFFFCFVCFVFLTSPTGISCHRLSKWPLCVATDKILYITGLRILKIKEKIILYPKLILFSEVATTAEPYLTLTLFKCTFSHLQLNLSVPQDSKKFHLQGLNVTGKTSSGKEKGHIQSPE